MCLEKLKNVVVFTEKGINNDYFVQRYTKNYTFSFKNPVMLVTKCSNSEHLVEFENSIF